MAITVEKGRRAPSRYVNPTICNFSSRLGHTKVYIEPKGELDYFGEVDKNGNACGFGWAMTSRGQFPMKFEGTWLNN